MFYALSEETVYHRFFHHVPAMPHARLQEFMRTDYERRMALVATPGHAEDQPILAVARYDLDRPTNTAEVAFVVRDEWQGKGLGTQLLGAITAAAREQGIAGFTASVLADNVGMLRVFHRSGHPIESRLVDGTYELTIRFEGAPGSATGGNPLQSGGEEGATAAVDAAGPPAN
jgi:RimJ/RimL family protein N-acetyltransferase